MKLKNTYQQCQNTATTDHHSTDKVKIENIINKIKQQNAQIQDEIIESNKMLMINSDSQKNSNLLQEVFKRTISVYDKYLLKNMQLLSNQLSSFIDSSRDKDKSVDYLGALVQMNRIINQNKIKLDKDLESDVEKIISSLNDSPETIIKFEDIIDNEDMMSIRKQRTNYMKMFSNVLMNYLDLPTSFLFSNDFNSTTNPQNIKQTYSEFQSDTEYVFIKNEMRRKSIKKKRNKNRKVINLIPSLTFLKPIPLF
jgi:hypothetical protein